MDPVFLVTDHMDILYAFRDAQEELTTDQIIELQKVQALCELAASIRLLTKGEE